MHSLGYRLTSYEARRLARENGPHLAPKADELSTGEEAVARLLHGRQLLTPSILRPPTEVAPLELVKVQIGGVVGQGVAIEPG